MRPEQDRSASLAEAVRPPGPITGTADLPWSIELEAELCGDLLLSSATLVLEQQQRRLQAAEAARIAAVLQQYDDTMADAAERDEPSSRRGWVARGLMLQLARSLRMSQKGAAHLLDTAREARARLPKTWAAFLDGGCPFRLLEIARRNAEGLEGDVLGDYDAQAAPLSQREASPDLERKLRRLREQLHPKDAAERAKKAAAGRTVVEELRHDGQASATFIGPATLVAGLMDGLKQAAVAAHGVPGEERCLGALMFDIGMDVLLHGLQQPAQVSPATPDEITGAAREASGDAAPPAGTGVVERMRAFLRVPQRKAVVPRILLLVPAPAAAGLTDQPAELAGYGPIPIGEAARIAAGSGVWTRVFCDPPTGRITGIDSDARKIPAALRKVIQARDGTCRTPGHTESAINLDLDHVRPVAADGQSQVDNLQCLCRSGHQMKDDGYWSVSLNPDGSSLWRSRAGKEYLVESPHSTRIEMPPDPPPSPPADLLDDPEPPWAHARPDPPGFVPPPRPNPEGETWMDEYLPKRRRKRRTRRQQ